MAAVRRPCQSVPACKSEVVKYRQVLHWCSRGSRIDVGEDARCKSIRGIWGPCEAEKRSRVALMKDGAISYMRS